ncbi:MAG: hypothetical protein K2H53_05470 [Clostridia bacterium]|nr:hypothetical protein [Clostridia bacterium]
MNPDGNWTILTLGGIGNVNGYDVWGKFKGARWGSSYYNANRPSGTGGLLTLYGDTLYNNGGISANGVDQIGYSYGNWTIRGGASGGGSVNIFARIVNQIGDPEAKGGMQTGTGFAGGNGGTGSVTADELGSSLNYYKKEIRLKLQDTYRIDESKLTYTKLNDIRTEDLSVGEVKYELVTGDSITVDNAGLITSNEVRYS